MQAQLKSLTNMVTSMNAQQVCDAKCQNERKINNLKTTYIKAKQNVQNAQPNLDRAEKDYYTAAKGASYYSKMQETKFKKQAEVAVAEWNNDLNPTWKDIENKLKYYSGLFSYKDNVHLVFDNYEEKYRGLVTDITNTRDKKNINFRLAHFMNYNTTIVNSVLYYLKILYWLFYVIMVVFFVLKKQYRNVLSCPFIIIAGLFPIFFEYGLKWKNPFKNEISKIPSLYERIFDNFKHAKIDNIYLIFFSLIIITILVFSFFTTIPYN